MINPKNSHEDLKGASIINFTILKKYIKIILIKYAMKCISSQHGNSQGIVNHIDKYYSSKTPMSKAQLLCINISLPFRRKIYQIQRKNNYKQGLVTLNISTALNRIPIELS